MEKNKHKKPEAADTLYRKKSNGRYEAIGSRILNMDYLREGIWLITKNPYSRSMTNILAYLGESNIQNIKDYSKLLSYKDEIADYLRKVCEGDEEPKGVTWKSKPKVYDASYNDVVGIILNRLQELIEEEKEELKETWIL